MREENEKIRFVATDETTPDEYGNDRCVHWDVDKKMVGYFHIDTNNFVRLPVARWRNRVKGQRIGRHQVFWKDNQTGCYEGDMFFPAEVFQARVAGQFQKHTRSIRAAPSARMH